MIGKNIVIFFLLIALTSSFVVGHDRYNRRSDNSQSYRLNEYGKGGKKHELAANRIAKAISEDGGKAIQEAESYAEDLADILGQLDSDALKRVLKGKIDALD